VATTIPEALMKPLLVVVSIVAGLYGVAGALAAQTDDQLKVASGKAVFEHTCAPCHAKGPGTDGAPLLPGAAALAARYQGKLSPFLEERGDLNAQALKIFVRRGIGSMPMFRKTEISDAQIEAVAAYLAAQSWANKIR
jgi:mono/diheme cytochrome c family protein